MDEETKDERLEAVKDKLNITWESEATDRRVTSVIATVTPVLNSRLGYKRGHEFAKDDGGPWSLFLNACLYEFSDALDDFWNNYGPEVRAERALIVYASDKEGEDAQG